LQCVNCCRQEKTKVLRDLKAQMQALLDEKDSMAGESQELTKQKAKLELNIKDLKDEEAGHKSSKVCSCHRLLMN